MAISGDNYDVVRQTMCFDIVRLYKGQEKVSVDDVLCAIAPSAVHIRKEDKEVHSLYLNHNHSVIGTEYCMVSVLRKYLYCQDC